MPLPVARSRHEHLARHTVTAFDYVVVGGGTAGCVVAARLAESGRHRVLLLEAGGSDDRFFVRMPIGYGKCFYDPDVNWMYRSGGRALARPSAGLLAARQAPRRLGFDQCDGVRPRLSRRLRRLGSARQSGMGLRERAAVVQADRKRGARRSRVARPRGPADRDRHLERRASAVPRVHRSRRSDRRRAQPRLQRRVVRGCGVLREQRASRAARVVGHGVAATGAATVQPDRGHARARDPRGLRGDAGDRGDLSHARRCARLRQRIARGGAVRGRGEHAPAPAAVGRGAGCGPACARHAGGRGSAGGRRAPAGSPLHRLPLSLARAHAQRNAASVARDACARGCSISPRGADRSRCR